MKIMTTVGGSSGALFATLLIGMSKKYNDELSDQKNIAVMFTEGVEAMKKRGKSDLGEKTMLDVLIPVSNEELLYLPITSGDPSLCWVHWKA